MQNELILDTWDMPWEPELAEMIDAVFVEAGASAASAAWARAAHAALVELLAPDEPTRVPLLTYDHWEHGEMPFRLMDQA